MSDELDKHLPDNTAPVDGLFIRPSDIHTAWKQWCARVNQVPKVSISIENCRWAILDAIYGTYPSDVDDVRLKLKDCEQPLKGLRQAAAQAVNSASTFDCDDVAFFLRGRIGGQALTRKMPVSYCFGVAVLKSPGLDKTSFDKISAMTSEVQFEHAINWLIVKRNASPCLMFVVVKEPSDIGGAPTITLEDAPVTQDGVPWGSVELILV